MRVLITGGAGFIGSHVAERLVTRGDSVHIVDDFSTGSRDNIEGLALTFRVASIADPDVVYRAFDAARPQVVLHAAASYADPEAWRRDIETNVLGSAAVAKCAKAYSARVIYLQTALAYGLNPPSPVNARARLQPEGSSYALSKAVGEQYLQLAGLDLVVFRLANMFGPRNLSGPVPTFYKRINEGKPCTVVNTRRDMVFVDDLVDVIMRAIDGAGSGTYNISSGRDYSIQSVFDAVVKAMGVNATATPKDRGSDDAATILLDPSRAQRDFGWEAHTCLEVGIKHAVRWYRDHGVTETYTHLKMGGAG